MNFDLSKVQMSGDMVQTGNGAAVNKDALDQTGYNMAVAHATSNGGQASPIPATPAVISSKDMAGQFNQNSAALAGKAANPLTPNPHDAPGYDPTKDPTSSAYAGNKGTGTDANSTAVEKGAAAGAGTGKQAIISTGDPVYDSLQNWEKDQEAKNEQQAAQHKAQVNAMLQTNLANNNSAFANQIQGIRDTFSGLIDTQNRINTLNVSRVKAYGLASGNAMSTPLEFTYAVSGEEQTAADKIQNLDMQRDDLISKAYDALNSSNAKLLNDAMTEIDSIEKDMQTQANALQGIVDQRYTVLQKIEDEQKVQLQKTQQNLIAAAITSFGQQYADETDPTKKDALIKSIVTQSGGQLDYGTVFGSLSANATALKTAKTTAAKDAADLALKAAQTTEANASAAKTFADAAKTKQTVDRTGAFSSIDNLLQPGQVMLDTATGKLRTDNGTYLDSDGYMTNEGFKQLLEAAHQKNINRADFLNEYAGFLSPNGYANYGLTKAEQDKINNINKATNIIIPQAAASGQ